jgi:hypothetical protein
MYFAGRFVVISVVRLERSSAISVVGEIAQIFFWWAAAGAAARKEAGLRRVRLVHGMEAV